MTQNQTPLTLLIRYHADITPIRQLPQGDWIDLRAAERVEMKAGEYRPISLGVSMRLPAGYEAHVAPRSSTFRRYGILLVNGVGVVDESYCGDNDIWYFPALAMRDTVIEKDERICQFRIMPKMAPVALETVACLDGPNRGGLGSTGTK